MAWPPPPMPINRTNADPQQDTHPNDHNAIGQAINDTVGYVQFLENGIRRKGFLASQDGQTFQSGEVNNFSWSGISDATWGTGPVFTIPADAVGVYVAVATVTGAAPAAGAFSDLTIIMRGRSYVDGINSGKQQASVAAIDVMAAGDTVYVQFYNSAGAAASIAATFNLLRVSV